MLPLTDVILWVTMLYFGMGFSSAFHYGMHVDLECHYRNSRYRIRGQGCEVKIRKKRLALVMLCHIPVWLPSLIHWDVMVKQTNWIICEK